MGDKISSTLETEQSIYLSADCIALQSMPPFLLIIIGIIIRTFIAFLITLKPDNTAQDKNANNSSKVHDIDRDAIARSGDTDTKQQAIALKRQGDDDEESSEPSEEEEEVTPGRELTQTDIINEKLNHSKCVRYLTLVLIAWQICSMTIIFILDAIKLGEFRASYAHYDAWNEFRCLSAILFISSNAQTMAINLCSMVIVYGECNIYRGWSMINVYKKIWFVAVLLLCLLYLPFILVFTLPGLFAYVWMTIPAIAIGLWTPKLLCCGCKYCFGTIYAAINDHTYEVIMAPLVLIFVYCLIGLTMINTYSGVQYFEALTLSIFEREWQLYVAAIGDSFENVLRLLTTLFG